MDEDMLVYPEEFKMGMKEELEHNDITGGDKEATKKIVLAHLKEDPKYYSKLTVAMKAEEEKSIIEFKKPEGTKIPKGDPKQELTETLYFPKKAEEVQDRLGRGHPGLSTQKEQSEFKTYGEKIKKQLENAKAEEESMGQYLKDIHKPIKHTSPEIHSQEGKPDAPVAVPRPSPLGKQKHLIWKSEENMTKTASQIIDSFLAEEEEKGGILDKIKSGLKDLTSSPKPEEYKAPIPLTKSFIHKQHNKAEEEYKKELDAPSMKDAVKPTPDVLGKPLGGTPKVGPLTPLKQRAEEEEFKIRDPLGGEDKSVRELTRKYFPSPTPQKTMQKQQKNLPPLKAEEDHNEDKLNELYSFVQWILDRQPNKQSYAQLKAQYDVEKFAEKAEEDKAEMEKPARFTADPKEEKCPS